MVLLNFNLHYASLSHIFASMQHFMDFIKKFLLFIDWTHRRYRNTMHYEPVKVGFRFWVNAVTASKRSLEGMTAALMVALNTRLSFT